jgi:hypothetical protein
MQDEADLLLKDLDFFKKKLRIDVSRFSPALREIHAV